MIPDEGNTTPQTTKEGNGSTHFTETFGQGWQIDYYGNFSDYSIQDESKVEYPSVANMDAIHVKYQGKAVYEWDGLLGKPFPEDDSALPLNHYFLTEDDTISGGTVSDQLAGFSGDDHIDGGAGFDTAAYFDDLSNYTISKTASSYTVSGGTDGTDTLSKIERLSFNDMTVNLTIQSLASSAPQADVQRLEELYVAFFNRLPDADGLAYWIGQMNAGQSINQIAESFYNAGIQYSDLTGFSATMTDQDFVNVIYRNVLGRSEGADTEGLAYWSNALGKHTETHGSLASSILASAHTYKGDATWGWVADLLDNKIAVAKTFAVDLGLTYNTPNDSISHGMAIAAAVTPTSSADAIALIGVSTSDIHLV
jgi:hypothetical protein